MLRKQQLLGVYKYRNTVAAVFIGIAGWLAGATDASAQIYLWKSPETVIPGTESITLEPGVDLSGLQLDGARLRGNLSNANLEGTQLNGAKVTARLNEANLKNVQAVGTVFDQISFRSVNAAGGDFRQTIWAAGSLANTNLANSDLRGAQFQRAELNTVNLTGALIDGAVFALRPSASLTAQQLYSTASYKNRNLTGIDFTTINQVGWDFRGQDLRNAVLGNVTGADFTDAIIGNEGEYVVRPANHVHLSLDQVLTTSSYKKKDLRGVQLVQPDFQGHDLSGMNLAGANFANLDARGANFSDAIIKDANLGGLIRDASHRITAEQIRSTFSYKKNDLSGTKLAGVHFGDGFSLPGMNLRGSDFSDSGLSGANLTAVDANAAMFNGADLTAASLPKSVLVAAELANASLQDADLTGANLFGATLANASLQRALLSKASIVSANLSGANLTGADLQDAKIQDVSFDNTIGFTKQQLASTASYKERKLVDVSVAGHDLSGLDLSGFQLQSANLAGTDLTGVSFHDAQIQGASFADATGFTYQKLISTSDYKNGKINNVNLQGLDMSQADFRNHVVMANFTNANLTGAQFNDATVGGQFGNAQGFTLDQLRSTTNFAKKDMRNFDLSGMHLRDVDLSEFQLAGIVLDNAQIDESVVFPVTPLNGASLRNVGDGINRLYPTREIRAAKDLDLSGNDLSGFQMTVDNLVAQDADLSHADLLSSEIDDIRGANIRGARLFVKQDVLEATASFQQRDLRGVDLRSSIVRGDFSGFNLQQASLFAANITSFRDADLTDARLTSVGGETDFTGANVTRASLSRIGAAQLRATQNYQGGSLQEMEITFSRLRDTDFSGRDLSGTEFNFSDLRGAKFDDAIVRNTSFWDTGLTAEQLQSTQSYQQGDLRGITLSAPIDASWGIGGHDLTEAFLFELRLEQGEEFHAPRSRIEILTSTLTNANLADSRLKTVVDSQLVGANLSGARIQELNETSLVGATLDKAEVGPISGLGQALNLNLDDASARNSRWGDLLIGNITARNADFAGAEFVRGRTPEAGIVNSDLSGASFRDATINVRIADTKLRGADLTGANFVGVAFRNVDFTDAEIGKASWRNSIGLTREMIYSTHNYKAKDLRDVDLRGVDVSAWDFTDQRINGAQFYLGLTPSQIASTASYKDRDLSGLSIGSVNGSIGPREEWLDWKDASLADQNLQNSRFSGVDLSNADFTRADLRGGRLKFTDLSQARFDDALVENANIPLTGAQLVTTASYKQKSLVGLVVERDIDADFSGVDLTRASLILTKSSRLDNAIINQASLYLDKSQLGSTLSYQQRDLRGVKLNVTWDGVLDLSSQDLTGATLELEAKESPRVDLSNAVVGGANLGKLAYAQLVQTKSYQDRDLTGVALFGDMKFGDFSGQDLTGAKIHGSVAGSDFTDAIIAHTSFDNLSREQLYATASYAMGQLPGANLADNRASWHEISLRGFDLRGSTVHPATRDLSFADLRGNAYTSSQKHRNVILTDRTGANYVDSMQLRDGEELLIRNQPGPIELREGATILDGSTLHVILDEDPWVSTLEVVTYRDVHLGGTLKITLDDGVDVQSIPTHIQLFDLSTYGPLPGLQFSNIELPSGVLWDLDNLYSEGYVSWKLDEPEPVARDFNVDGLVDIADADLMCSTIAAGDFIDAMDVDGDGQLSILDMEQFLEAEQSFPGDADFDGQVSFPDFLALARGFGQATTWSGGDFDCDGSVEFTDFLRLARNFGSKSVAAVPEPETLPAAAMLAVLTALARARRSRRQWTEWAE